MLVDARMSGAGVFDVKMIPDTSRARAMRNDETAMLYSSLIPAALMTFAQRADSSFM